MSMQFAWSTANIGAVFLFPLSSSLLLLLSSPLARTIYNKCVEGGKIFRRVCNLMGQPLLFVILLMFPLLMFDNYATSAGCLIVLLLLLLLLLLYCTASNIVVVVMIMVMIMMMMVIINDDDDFIDVLCFCGIINNRRKGNKYLFVRTTVSMYLVRRTTLQNNSNT